MKIVSSGQTEASLGGLLAAKLHRLETGGSMPYIFRDQTRTDSIYNRLFNIYEHESYELENIKNSQGTIRVSCNFDRQAEKRVLNGILEYNKPYLDIEVQEANPIIKSLDVYNIYKFINNNDIKILHIFGSNQTWPGIAKHTALLFSYVFMRMGYDRIKLSKEYSKFLVE